MMLLKAGKKILPSAKLLFCLHKHVLPTGRVC